MHLFTPVEIFHSFNFHTFLSYTFCENACDCITVNNVTTGAEKTFIFHYGINLVVE